MDEQGMALIASIKELFTSQTKGIDTQLGEIKAQALRAEGKTEDVRQKIDDLIKSNSKDVRELKDSFYTTINDIENQIEKLSFILAYKKLLQTAKFIIEWKALFVPAFVVFCVLSTVGGIKTYEAGREFVSEWVAQKRQVDVNTKAVDEIKQEEIKNILK